VDDILVIAEKVEIKRLKEVFTKEICLDCHGRRKEAVLFGNAAML